MVKDKSKNITLKDIAEHVGVSLRTVSLAVQGQGRMADETRKRIMDVVSEWNYRPNIMARGLANKKTYLLGVIIPYVSKSFYSEVLAGIEDKCKDNFYDLLLRNCGEDLEVENNALERMLDRKVDGIISYPNPKGYEPYKRVIDAKIPIVFISRVVPGLNVPSVMVDGEAGVFDAVEKLILSGRKKIAYLGASSGTPLMNSRRDGYRKALVKHGIALDLEKYEYSGGVSFRSGYDDARNIFSKKIPLDAIVACTDQGAIGAIKACNESNFRVPEDISVVGFDGVQLGEIQSQCALSTVAQPRQEIGHAAFDLFMKIMRKEKADSVILKTRFLERETTININ
jgi:DNA-binding LacI/PurR family transcriptional regulator